MCSIITEIHIYDYLGLRLNDVSEGRGLQSASKLIRYINGLFPF